MFSDNDLKRLKLFISVDVPTWIVTPELLKALIARLEASERCTMRFRRSGIEDEELYIAWLRNKGE